MAITITPGYDFGINEVPEKLNFLRQAEGLSISGIGLSQMDVDNLTALLAGDVSGETGASLLGLGWMWADPQGSIWLESGTGPVRMFRAMGGYETKRYPFETTTQSMAVRGGHLSAQGDSENDIVIKEHDVGTSSTGDIFTGVTHGTFASGSSDVAGAICHMRGGTFIFVPSEQLSELRNGQPVYRTFTGTPGSWGGENLQNDSHVKKVYFARGFMDDPNFSVTATLTHAAVAWYFGPAALVGPGTAF